MSEISGISKFQIGGTTKLAGGSLDFPKSVSILGSIEGNIQAGTIKGKDNEYWNKWLVSNIEEFDDIKDERLKIKIRLLARRSDSMNNPDHLEKVHHEIEGLIEAGLSLEDAAIWLKRIEDKQQFVTGQLSIHRDRESIPLRDQSLYLGAVYKNGQNEPYLVSQELVIKLNPENPEHRKKFVFRNLYAFNYLYLKSTRMSSAWLNATQNFEVDLIVAKEKGAKILNKEVEDSNKFLEAAMGVTGSARSFESSEGAFETYGKILTGGDRGPETGWQDTWDSYLLHADPEKITTLLNDPLVSKFYEKLMSDAGLKQNDTSEWHGDGFQTPRELTFSKNKDAIMKGKLIKYLKDSAAEDGFEGYIDKVLLKEVSTNEEDLRVKKAAARLACDIFLVDKYTEYVNLLPKADIKGKDYKLQPKKKGWGGDPFDFVINPTGLQRIKKTYTGTDRVVLDMLDSAFRPKDIYETLERRHQIAFGKPLSKSVRLPIASAVTNIKTLNRQSQMIGKVTGGPMAPNLSRWSGPAQNDLLEAELLAAQVLGTQEVAGDEIGREIAGAQIIRILEAKILASTLETLPPDNQDIATLVFDPNSKFRALYDARTFLLGPEFNFKQGHLQALQGGDYSFVIAENAFADDNYQNLLKILQSNDQSGNLNSKFYLTLGFAIRSGNSLATALGITGGR